MLLDLFPAPSVPSRRPGRAARCCKKCCWTYLALGRQRFCKKYCWTHSAQFALAGALRSLRKMCWTYFTFNRAQSCCKKCCWTYSPPTRLSVRTAFVASGGWFSDHWPTTNRYQARDWLMRRERTIFPNVGGFRALRPASSGPNSMRNRASAPNSVSGRSWRPVSFRFHLPLNSGNPKNVPGPIRAGSDYSLTYSTRKTSTDPSGFRSTTGGRAATGKMFFGLFALSSPRWRLHQHKDVHGSGADRRT
jgi:hypothetical protein